MGDDQYLASKSRGYLIARNCNQKNQTWHEAEKDKVQDGAKVMAL
jgi:hypothetical protein